MTFQRAVERSAGAAARGELRLRGSFRVALGSTACALAAACAGSTPARQAPAPVHPVPSPCVYVADTAAAPVDTIRFVGEQPVGGRATLQQHTATCPADTAAATAHFVVDSVTLPRGTDLRDVLDRGIPVPGTPRADVVVTRDPEVLSYAAQRNDYRSVPLPWDRTYVLITRRTTSDSIAPTTSELDALARDAVQAEARGAQPPFWWQGDTSCTRTDMNVPSGVPRAVGYAAGDAIARQLAERIVALAGTRPAPAWVPALLTGGGPVRTTVFAPVAVHDAVTSGQVAAVVAAYPRFHTGACDAGMRLPPNADVIPLVDSRARVLVRRGSGAAFYIAGDGTLHFAPARTP